MQFQTYPAAWSDHYTRQGYALRDPTIAWGFSTTGASRWSEFTLPDPFNILGEARRYGLNYGVTISCGPLSSRTIASCTSRAREFTDAEIDAISHLILVITSYSIHYTKLYEGAADRGTVRRRLA